MKNIPNVSFQSEENNKDFELIVLSELFSRMDSMKGHHPSLPHRITFFALLIVTEGVGVHQVDLNEYNLQKGSVLRISKNQVHAFQWKPQYEGVLIIFTEHFVMNYFSKSSIGLISHLYNYHLNIPLFDNLNENKSLIKQIESEIERKNDFVQNNIIAAYLDLYLLKLERLTSEYKGLSGVSKQFHVFDQFKSLVEANYTKTRNVKDYASLLLVSSKTLNAAVKTFTFNTAKCFIDEYVILEIKREIISTNKSLKEIAFDTGFDEMTNFTKFFKNKVNMNPKGFKLSQMK